MNILHDYGLVRVISVGDPFKNSYDIQVQLRESVDSEWILYHGFNSLSDDYAYTNAREAAARAISKLATKIANSYS